MDTKMPPQMWPRSTKEVLQWGAILRSEVSRNTSNMEKLIEEVLFPTLCHPIPPSDGIHAIEVDEEHQSDMVERSRLAYQERSSQSLALALLTSAKSYRQEISRPFINLLPKNPYGFKRTSSRQSETRGMRLRRWFERGKQDFVQEG